MGRRSGSLTTIDEKDAKSGASRDMHIRDYFHQIQNALNKISSISTQNITFDERSEFIGYITGQITFIDGSRLHLSEYIDVEYTIDRIFLSFDAW
jgi:hypothetical protein